jgi:hypothetical protein
MSDRKEFLYIPSLSAGSMVSAFKKDTKFEDGTTMRFFAKEYPEKWRHPYFLVTAGHHYKKMDFRDQLGLDDGTFVFGDSGGFQIATGALKWDGTIREKIFHWLEANSDVAANLDIPPRVTFENRFHDAMDISFDNFKYFEKNQREFEKKHIEYIHLLGISKISDFFILATLQELLNKMTDNRIQLMSDSSSPGQYPVFGTYLHSGNYKTQTFTELYFPKNAEYRRKTHIKQGKGGEITIDKTKHVPCSMGCPACNDFTYEYLGGKTDAGLDRYSQEGMPRMVVHNTHLYCEIVKDINKLTNNHVELLETAIPKELFNVILSLHEMFADPDNAMNVYSAYKKTYKKFGGESISTTDVKQFNKFFKF